MTKKLIDKVPAEKIKFTNKLYFKKYAYKIVCRSPIQRGMSSNEMYFVDRSFSKSLLKILENRQDYKYRVTHSYQHVFFFNDETLKTKILNKVGKHLVWLYQPGSESELNLMKDNLRIRPCNKYPYNLFQYKISLRSRMKVDKRISFLNWISKYSKDDIRISCDTKRYLDSIQSYYCYNPFLYVRDSKILSMVGMYLGNDIRTTEQYILRNDINK